MANLETRLTPEKRLDLALDSDNRTQLFLAALKYVQAKNHETYPESRILTGEHDEAGTARFDLVDRKPVTRWTFGEGGIFSRSFWKGKRVLTTYTQDDYLVSVIDSAVWGYVLIVNKRDAGLYNSCYKVTRLTHGEIQTRPY